MSFMVVVLLGGLWASILLPGALRARRDASPMNSIDSFERSMDMLALHSGTRLSRPPGRHVMVLEQPAAVTRAGDRTRMLRRRRQMFVRLVAGTAISGALSLLVGGMLLYVFVAMATALSSYVALLVQLRARQEQVQRKVRRLPPPRTHRMQYAPQQRRVGHG